MTSSVVLLSSGSGERSCPGRILWCGEVGSDRTQTSTQGPTSSGYLHSTVTEDINTKVHGTVDEIMHGDVHSPVLGEGRGRHGVPGGGGGRQPPLEAGHVGGPEGGSLEDGHVLGEGVHRSLLSRSYF